MKTTTETMLATANNGAFHLARTKMHCHARRGLGVPMTDAESKSYWLGQGKKLPSRERTVYVIRMGIVDGIARGGCDVTHALTEGEAFQAWEKFLARRVAQAAEYGTESVSEDAGSRRPALVKTRGRKSVQVAA